MQRCKAGIFLLVYWFASSVISAPAASAQTAFLAQRLYGTWYSYPLGNPATDSIRHEFRNNPETGKDEMIVSRICEGEDIAVIARVTTPIDVSANAIKILQGSSRSEKKKDGSDCQASIDAAVWGYVISRNGDRISITNPGGVPDSFQLARQDVASDAILPPSVYGSWLLPVQQEHGATVQITLIFYESAVKDRGKIRQISTCSKANDSVLSNSVLSQADSTLKITKDQITILEAASHEESNGSISCLATISPGTLHYTVSPNGGTMVLSKPGASPIVLTRER
jgi:hypothetical protein